MLDPIQITITDVTLGRDGLDVECLWQWGIRPPQELIVTVKAPPIDADDVREQITTWVLAEAEAQYDDSPLRYQLTGERWTIEFEEDEQPFEATRVEEALGFMLRRAAEKERASKMIIFDDEDEDDPDAELTD